MCVFLSTSRYAAPTLPHYYCCTTAPEQSPYWYELKDLLGKANHQPRARIRHKTERYICIHIFRPPFEYVRLRTSMRPPLFTVYYKAGRGAAVQQSRTDKPNPGLLCLRANKVATFPGDGFSFSTPSDPHFQLLPAIIVCFPKPVQLHCLVLELSSRQYLADS